MLAKERDGVERGAQIGRYFLSKRPNSPYWCRSWYDETKRQTRRESLGTKDASAAALALANWVTEFGATQRRTSRDYTIAEACARYYALHCKHMPPKSESTQRINLRIVVENIGELTISEFRIAEQEKFARALRGKYKNGTVKRIFDTAFAAFNFVLNNDEIDTVPKKLALPSSEPRLYVPRLKDLETFWHSTKSAHLQDLFVALLSTGARPSTILDLEISDCDFEHGLINLSPTKHVPNNKRRPTIAMANSFRDHFSTRSSGPLISKNGAALAYINKGWRQARRDLRIDEQFTPGSIRHFVATRLRAANVPPQQISGLLGHSIPNWKTTERYAKFSPAFMADAIRQIDITIDEIKNSVHLSH